MHPRHARAGENRSRVENRSRAEDEGYDSVHSGWKTKPPKSSQVKSSLFFMYRLDLTHS